MANIKRRRVSRKNSIKFKPSRKSIESAVKEYLKSGGKITKLEAKRDFAEIISVKSGIAEADEFLAGE